MQVQVALTQVGTASAQSGTPLEQVQVARAQVWTPTEQFGTAFVKFGEAMGEINRESRKKFA